MAKGIKTIFIRVRGRVIPIRKAKQIDSDLGEFVKIKRARKARRKNPSDKFIFKLTESDLQRGKSLGKRIGKRRRRLKIK